MVDGIEQRPIEGVSMVYTFDKANADNPTTHTTQYFEMIGDRAIYHEGWIACTAPIGPPGMTNGPVIQRSGDSIQVGTVRPDQGLDAVNDDLAAANPEKLKELQESVLEEARKYQVLPLDASVATRLVTPRPEHHRGPDRIRLHAAASPASRRATRRCF